MLDRLLTSILALPVCPCDLVPYFNYEVHLAFSKLLLFLNGKLGKTRKQEKENLSHSESHNPDVTPCAGVCTCTCM